MAIDAAPTPIRALRAVSGVRSDARRVALLVNDALAPTAEGIAFCAEVEQSASRIVNFAALGSRRAVVNEAGRLATRAAGYRERFRAMALGIEGPDR